MDKPSPQMRYYLKNKDDPEWRDKRIVTLLSWRHQNIEAYLLQRAKGNAKSRGLEFAIDEEDIIVPEVCPVFSTEFVYGTEYAASIDRIDNSMGYIPGNIQVISRKANTMKANATKEELERFAKWLIKN